MKKILLSFLLTVTFAVPAFSQMMDMHMKGPRGEHGQRMEMGNMCMMDCDMMCLKHANMLGLTDEQMSKMKIVYREMQKKQIRYRADFKLAEIELEEIMEVKNFNLENANFAVKKIGDIKTAHQLEILKAMKDMRTILTDDQFKNMCKMMPMKMHEKKPLKKEMHKPSPKKQNSQQQTVEPKPKTQADDTTHKH